MFLYSRIDDVLIDKKVTKEALANGIGVSLSSVKKWTAGSTIPGADKIEALADFFKVPMEFFFDREISLTNTVGNISGSGNNIQNGHNGHINITQSNAEKEIEHLKSLLMEKEQMIKEKDERLKDKDKLIELLSRNQ